MPESPKIQNPLTVAGGIVGAIGGWSLSHYAGPSLWIPGGATVLLLLLFTKTPLRPRFYLGAITVTGGHVISFIVGGAVTGGWLVVLPDIIVLSIGVIWLWLRPGLAATLFLGIVQLLSLGINGASLSLAKVGSFEHRALTVHCVFRLIAIICLVAGYVRVRKAQISAPSSSVLTTEGLAPPNG